jgi:hypothetical protein
MLDRRRIVGLAKYTEIDPGDYWLEGLRVDPGHRNQGLGWQMSEFILRRVLAERPKTLRLATGRRNRHSRRLVRRMGLRVKVSLWGREGPVPRDQTRPRVFVPTARAAFDFIRRTDEYREARHLLQHTWHFRTITCGLLADLIRKGRVFAAGAPEDVRGILILQPGRYGRGRLEVSFIEGDRKSLPEFRRKIAELARRHKAKSVAGIARSRSMLRHFGGLRMRRWRRPGRLPHVMVYEYPLPASRA